MITADVLAKDITIGFTFQSLLRFRILAAFMYRMTKKSSLPLSLKPFGTRSKAKPTVQFITVYNYTIIYTVIIVYNLYNYNTVT